MEAASDGTACRLGGRQVRLPVRVFKQVMSTLCASSEKGEGLLGLHRDVGWEVFSPAPGSQPVPGKGHRPLHSFTHSFTIYRAPPTTWGHSSDQARLQFLPGLELTSRWGRQRVSLQTRSAPNGRRLERQLTPGRGLGLCMCSRDATVISNVKFYFKVLLVRKLPLPHGQVHVNEGTGT